MKAKAWILSALSVLIIAVWWVVIRDDWAQRGSAGVSALSILQSVRNHEPAGTFVCYTAEADHRCPALFGGTLSFPNDPKTGNAVVTTVERMFGPSFFRSVDGNGAINGQFAGPDRLYYIGIGRDRINRVCLARKSGGNWSPESSAMLDRDGSGSWNADGIRWISVLTPSEGGGVWRMWYVGGHNGGNGQVAYATSADGVRWRKTPGHFVIASRGPIRSISVIPFAGGLRAWYVEPGSGGYALNTAPISSQTGMASEPGEPVSWQAPRDWRLGLPKENIPILDARAEPGPDGPRHVRLFITYRGPDGKPRITVAEDFPVGSVREPTVFSRQVEPVISAGKDP